MSIYHFLECEKGVVSIPERLKEFQDLIYSDVPVRNFQQILSKFTLCVLVELSSQVGGMQYFLSQGQTEESMLDAWEMAISDYTAAHIFFAIEYVLSAKYDRAGSFCPKYPLHFRHLLKDLFASFEFNKLKIFPKINNAENKDNYFSSSDKSVMIDQSEKMERGLKVLIDMRRIISESVRVNNNFGGKKWQE